MQVLETSPKHVYRSFYVALVCYLIKNKRCLEGQEQGSSFLLKISYKLLELSGNLESKNRSVCAFAGTVSLLRKG